MEASPQTLPAENLRPTKTKHLNRGPFNFAKILIGTFQKSGRRHDHLKSEHVRLITIGISHYCEKVRWGLDLLESDPSSPFFYTEDAHPPALAAVTTLQVSKGEASQCPMVVLVDKTKSNEVVLSDSTTILKTLCSALYPIEFIDEITSVEQYLDARLGPTVRCFLYNELLRPQYYPSVANLCTSNTSLIESIVFKQMIGSGLADGMRKAMTINDDTALLSLEEIRNVFDIVSDMLSDGREYLIDSRKRMHQSVGFTAADLTFAALAGAIIMPPELKLLQLEEKDLPLKLIEVRDELRLTPAGKYCLFIYRKHRFSVDVNQQLRSNKSSPRHVKIKSVDRNAINQSKL